MALIALFLVVQAIDPIRTAGWHFLTEFQWIPDGLDNGDGVLRPLFGVGAVLYGTVVCAVIALVFAVPVAVATAIFINEYAPRRLRGVLTGIIDLLAAVPSLIYGLWGLTALQPRMNGITNFLATKLSFIPFFETDVPFFGNSLFMAGLVLSLMILPIITSVSREVFGQVPRANCEAALALGGSRWGMVRHVILPHGRSGVVGGAMLGLGRALGETIAVAVILGATFDVSSRILQPGGNTIAALIANQFGEASEFGRNALIAAGLALFVLTLLVNLAARAVVNRSANANAGAAA